MQRVVIFEWKKHVVALMIHKLMYVDHFHLFPFANWLLADEILLCTCPFRSLEQRLCKAVSNCRFIDEITHIWGLWTGFRGVIAIPDMSSFRGICPQDPQGSTSFAAFTAEAIHLEEALVGSQSCKCWVLLMQIPWRSCDPTSGAGLKCFFA